MIIKHNKNCTSWNQSKTVFYVQNLSFQENLLRLKMTERLQTLWESKFLNFSSNLVDTSSIVTITDVYIMNLIQDSIIIMFTISLNEDFTCEKCTVVAESVQLIYWLKSTFTTINNSKIKSIFTNSITDATIILTLTDIVMTVINDTTFTFSSIYLSYFKVSTIQEFYNNTDKSYSDVLLNLNLSALSSLKD